jgi:hypothetical protein
MDYVSLKYNIKPTEIFGYSVVGGNNVENELYEFPGFKILLQHMIEENPLFSFWIKNPELRRGGILKKYIRAHNALDAPLPTTSFHVDFDVIKKRRVMELSTPIAAKDDTSPEALAAFEDFERSVLPALERVQAADDDGRNEELLELEDSIAKGLQISATGGVYFGWSDCLGCMKIGATRRDDPGPRLRELSRHVTVPFSLIGWIPTHTPFRLEKQAHAYFASARIRHAGAGTEFFRIDAEAARTYCCWAASIN